MTKNKRFVYYEHKGADYILDSPNKSLDFIEMLGDCLEAEEIVDLLNEFYEENKKLQFQCNYLQEGASEFYHKARENANRVGQLKRENKELKLQLDALKNKLCELGMPNEKRDDKRFRIAVSNDNTVRLIDHKEINDLISIRFKEHSDAIDCSDALQYLCNLMNGLSDENGQLRKENDMLSCELSVSANKEISRNCRIAELEEENEQLKQENEKLQGEYDYLLWLYNGLGCEYDWLKEENEQLKKKSKRSYYIL